MEFPPALIKSKDQGVLYLFERRARLFEAVRQAYQKAITDRTYHVIRGAVNWTEWDFKAHPFAVSMMSKNNSFMAQVKNDFNTMTLVLEVFTGTKDPNPSNPLETIKLMDGILDDIFRDTVLVLNLLPCVYDDRENPLVMKYDIGENATEVHDHSATVQGVVFEITLDY